MPNVQRLLLKVFSRLPDGVLLKLSGGKPIEIRGRRLDPFMQLLWVQGKQQAPISAFPPPRSRAVVEGATELLTGTVPGGVTIQNQTIPTGDGELPARIYSVPSDTPLPVVLFFHQGGFVIGGLNTCHAFCALIAKESGCVVVNVEYRKAPEHPFPAPVNDAFESYRWVLNHAGEMGGDPDRVGVCGDSAGGMLAALICQEAQRQGWPMPKCQALIYPWLVPHSGLAAYEDFGDAYPLTASLMEWFAGHYFSEGSQRSDPLATPGEQDDLAGQPPALVVAAGFDPLCDEAAAYAARLEAAGVPVTYRLYERLPHSFCMMGISPAALAAQRELAVDLRGLLY